MASNTRTASHKLCAWAALIARPCRTFIRRMPCELIQRLQLGWSWVEILRYSARRRDVETRAIEQKREGRRGTTQLSRHKSDLIGWQCANGLCAPQLAIPDSFPSPPSSHILNKPSTLRSTDTRSSPTASTCQRAASRLLSYQDRLCFQANIQLNTRSRESDRHPAKVTAKAHGLTGTFDHVVQAGTAWFLSADFVARSTLVRNCLEAE